jgi:hypothetical protein
MTAPPKRTGPLPPVRQPTPAPSDANRRGYQQRVDVVERGRVGVRGRCAGAHRYDGAIEHGETSEGRDGNSSPPSRSRWEAVRGVVLGVATARSARDSTSWAVSASSWVRVAARAPAPHPQAGWMRVADVLADDAGAQAATSGRWVRFISAYGTARRWRPRTDQPLRRSTDGNTGEQVVAVRRAFSLTFASTQRYALDRYSPTPTRTPVRGAAWDAGRHARRTLRTPAARRHIMPDLTRHMRQMSKPQAGAWDGA